ncbi:DUF19 domain-containing protein [Caenorhabditis elegans]|uniref:DUF19 domain-containing protein n=1 Tax=Caenorhabditis elegans TaxID=6239 RepID=D2Y8W3_CAEEL|nr:DUF19 domain-containing protein [Caenorhabditis elegans]CBI83235.1 DUF19 domain-containing protein [Caenorhabditis elegans]|eukprot:NP_001254432.1 Uncharacterized protein CELE_K10H10.13 [Caenorhabditis elegans]
MELVPQCLLAYLPPNLVSGSRVDRCRSPFYMKRPQKMFFEKKTLRRIHVTSSNLFLSIKMFFISIEKKINFQFSCLLPLFCLVICEYGKDLSELGIHFDNAQELEFLRVENFKHDFLPENYYSDTCQVAKDLCHQYLECTNNCHRLIKKWEEFRSRWQQEPASVNPCVLMEIKCSGMSNYDAGQHLDDFL